MSEYTQGNFDSLVDFDFSRIRNVIFAITNKVNNVFETLIVGELLSGTAFNDMHIETFSGDSSRKVLVTPHGRYEMVIDLDDGIIKFKFYGK